MIEMPFTTMAVAVFMYCIFIMPFTKRAQERINEPGNMTNMYLYIGSMLLSLLFFALGI